MCMFNAYIYTYAYEAYRCRYAEFLEMARLDLQGGDEMYMYIYIKYIYTY